MAKKSKPRRRLRIGNLILLIGIPIGLFFGFREYQYRKYQNPIQSYSEEVLFTVPGGSSAKAVVQKLEEQDIISNANVAYRYAKKNELTNIKAGDFLIDKSWALGTILETLNDSSKTIIDDVRITIVEGDWVKHIAQKIGASTSVSEEELLSLWNNKSYVQSLKDSYPFITDEIISSDPRFLLEGYLAPDTYIFFQDISAEEITEKILNQSNAIYNQLKDDIQKSNYSIHEIYTLASIIQYESGNPSEMKRISGVFHNRLDIDMPLQSSVTVCYAIDINKDDDWWQCEINGDVDSPYNTYKYGGLPPGPIENPGYDALYAALHPEKHNYFYFMADVNGDGTVYYAETLEEHNANVAKYLR